MLFMENSFDKPFKTIDEQIKIIKERNVIIDTSPFVIEALTSISYYTLMNGYKNTFLSKKGTEDFKDNTSFEMIYTLHWVDLSISNIMFKYILLVEKSLKTKLSYYIGNEFGIDKINYLDDFRNYANPNGRRSGIINDVKDVIRNCKNDSSTAYYRDQKNHVPPWIIVNDITFGLTQLWYSILKEPGKTQISNQFLDRFSTLDNDDKKELLSKCIEILRSFRNKVAHGSRTFDLKLIEEMPKTQIFKLCTNDVLTEAEYDKGLGKSDIFAVLLSLIILINDNIILTNMIEELKIFLAPYVEKNIRFIDKTIFDLLHLPADTIARLDRLIDTKPSKNYESYLLTSQIPE